MARPNSTLEAQPAVKPSRDRDGAARVVPLVLRTDPPVTVAAPSAQSDRTFLRIEVPYDVQAVAHAIAPILDRDAEALAHALRAGHVVDGPHSHADAAGLVSTLAHFGAICALEEGQSLGQMPVVHDPRCDDPIGRYVQSASRPPAGIGPAHREAGAGE